MTFLTLVLIAIIILAVIGLGWNTFAIAVLDGFDKTLEIGIPILKNLTQEAQATSDSDREAIDDAIEEKQAGKNDELMKTAQEIYLNGSCMPGEDKMMLLTVPDPEAAKLAMSIPDC